MVWFSPLINVEEEFTVVIHICHVYRHCELGQIEYYFALVSTLGRLAFQRTE